MNHLVGPGEQDRVQHALSIVADRADLDGLRVLDLACRTGAFSAGFAAAGADVLGIEGRQENLDHVPQTTARFTLGDVRDLTIKKYGRFDVVLCFGILYHLEPADAIRLLIAMRRITKRFAVIDTHIGVHQAAVSVDGHEYCGNWYGENTDHPWSAIGNTASWWFACDSLDDALRHAGWNSVTYVAGKGWPGEADDRAWLVVE